MQFAVDGRAIELMEGDITRVSADAIVNAANSALAGGGGVDGAIHRAGGPEIMRELDEIRPRVGRCVTGDAVVTGAGRLDARHVFHTVGPVYRDGKHGEPDLLASCYRTCLRLADEHGESSIAFPAISTGVYGYPAADAAHIAVREVVQHLKSGNTTLTRVLFVVFDRTTAGLYEKALKAALGLRGRT
jgi:O-acetyl-ADP-ribose deacetylase (regulator of RNase III)